MSAVLVPHSIEFRPMTEADLDRVHAIEILAYPHPWTRGNFSDCLASGYSGWVAVREGEIVGYSIFMMGAGEGHVLNCCVHPRYQNQGIGRQLMRGILAHGRGMGLDAIYLEVRPSNQPALALYQDLGFETIALRRGYYPAGNGREDALVMRYAL